MRLVVDVVGTSRTHGSIGNASGRPADVASRVTVNVLRVLSV